MRVLITWGSQRGGTEGIARALGEALTNQGFDVTLSPAHSVRILPNRYEAAIVGGALYAQRWQRDARRAVTRSVDALRRMPVWFFSSGPLDDSADCIEIPATVQVAALMKRVGAQGHRTFGGRLTPDAKGFPASAMAKQRSGDFRNFERVRAWALELAQALPNAKAAGVIEQPASSAWHAGLHGAVAWATCASLRAALHYTLDASAAFAIYLVLVPLVYSAVAWYHFRARRAPEVLASAIVFTALFALFEGLLSIARIADELASSSQLGSRWPLVLIFLATWITGSLTAAPSARSDVAQRP